MDLYGSIDLFHIERLIRDYVTKGYAGFGPAQFSLTERGWELAQIIKRRYQEPE
jgi:hypothetical protein